MAARGLVNGRGPTARVGGMSAAKVCGSSCLPAENIVDIYTFDIVETIANQFQNIGGGGGDEIADADRLGDDTTSRIYKIHFEGL